MADPYIGEIRLFGGQFAPRGWAFCDGALLRIIDNQPLFSLIGNIYGGDGENTFALPDLRGRVPVGQGRGNGLTERRLGERFGVAEVTLQVAEMPAHTHALNGSGAPGTTPVPGVPAVGPDAGYGPPDALMADGLAAEGGGQPHENRPPVLGVHYIIALLGIFPARD
ncbi:MAG: phage tail protein [Myxococcales bacterium]|nr:phage tail protein [Myxococcales bacterium]